MVSFGILEICTCSRIKLPCTKPFHCILFKWWIWYISYVISAMLLEFFFTVVLKICVVFFHVFPCPSGKNRTRRNPVEWIPWKWGTLSPKLKYLGGSDEFLQGRTIFAWHFIATYSRRLVTPKGSEKVGESYQNGRNKCVRQQKSCRFCVWFLRNFLLRDNIPLGFHHH